MDNKLKECLMSSIFRFKKVGMLFPPIPPEFDIHMGELFVLGSIKDNIPEIQHNLHITKPAVSQILNSLEKKGYINRTIDTTDRRRIVAELTPEGETVVCNMKKHMDGMLDEIFTRFGEDNVNQLISLFNRFADIAEDMKNEAGNKEK